MVGKLDRTMYGTLDAAERWAEYYSQILVQAGFRRGTASPCHFYHSSRDLWVLVHGDDFFSVGEPDDQEYLRQVMQDSFEIKCDRASPKAHARNCASWGALLLTHLMDYNLRLTLNIQRCVQKLLVWWGPKEYRVHMPVMSVGYLLPHSGKYS